MKKKENKFVCCICGRKTQGYGNNPWPIKDHGKCCNECNEKVIKARIKSVYCDFK
jgi:hypothetical protein